MECGICQDCIVRDCIIIECSHRFCESCILAWLGTSNTCPMCRADVFAVMLFDGTLKQIAPAKQTIEDEYVFVEEEEESNSLDDFIVDDLEEEPSSDSEFHFVSEESEESDIEQSDRDSSPVHFRRNSGKPTQSILERLKEQGKN